MQTITREAAVKMIQDSNGKMMSVTFIKRSDGEHRTMNIRTGVRKHIAGGERAYDPKEHGLLWVYSMDAAGYRSIPVEGITYLKANGQEYSVN